MTAPERLAKVAEVLHHEGWPVEPGWKLTPDTCGTCATTLRLAEALAPLLDEFQAEDHGAGVLEGVDSTWHLKQIIREAEARGAARVREAVEALADEYDERSRDTEDGNRYPWGVAADDLRAALDGAEKENHDG